MRNEFYTKYKKAMEEKARLFGSNGTDFDKIDSAVDAICAASENAPGWHICFYHVAGEVSLSTCSDWLKLTKRSVNEIVRVIEELTNIECYISKKNKKFVLSY